MDSLHEGSFSIFADQQQQCNQIVTTVHDNYESSGGSRSNNANANGLIIPNVDHHHDDDDDDDDADDDDNDDGVDNDALNLLSGIEPPRSLTLPLCNKSNPAGTEIHSSDSQNHMAEDSEKNLDNQKENNTRSMLVVGSVGESHENLLGNNIGNHKLSHSNVWGVMDIDEPNTLSHSDIPFDPSDDNEMSEDSSSCYHPGFQFVAPPPKLKASVWQHFGFYRYFGSHETHFDRTLCKLCNNLLAYNTGCTTNMRQHLIRSHGIEPKSLIDMKSSEKVKKREFSDSQKTKCKSIKRSLPKNNENNGFEFVSPPSSLKALVWKHFGFYKERGSNKTRYDKTWCMLCDHLMVYSGGNTTNMRAHLARHHGIQLASLASSSGQIVETEKTERQLDDKDTIGKETQFTEKFEFVAAKPSLKALVWRYFGFYKLVGSDETNVDHTCCRLCKTMIRYTCGSTTNMRNHLLRTHGIDLQALDGSSRDDLPIESVKDLKRVLKRQSCGNTSCNKPIQLEADGSVPQFCSGCGLLLSPSLSEYWASLSTCCKVCGKVKDQSKDAHFCSRCGSYMSSEVDIYSHRSSSPDGEEACESSAAEETSESDSTEASDEMNLRTGVKEELSDMETSSLQCEFCCYTADDWTDLKDHIKVHLDLNTDPDLQESLSLIVDEQKGRLHNLIDQIKEQKQFEEVMDALDATHKCEYCDRAFDNEDELRVHTARHENTTDGASHTPPNCKTLRTQASDKHSKTKASLRVPRPRHCKTCNAEFPNLVLLRNHEQAASCSVQMLACDECEYVTQKLEALRGHKRRNHGDIILKKCDYCDRQFKRQRNLEEHMNTHTGSTPFQCDKCGKAFHTNSSWYKHKRNNCETGPRDRKLCSLCGKAVINLSKHISDVHFHIKGFQCETCNKQFGTQYHLDRHVRTHTGEKPYPCRYCDYRASQKVVTDGHMRKCKYRPIATSAAAMMSSNE